MDAQQLKDEVGEGGVDRLIELIASQQRKLQDTQQQLNEAQQQLEAAQKRIEELEKELGRSPTKKLDEPFSVRSEEQRQQQRGKKRRRPKKTPKRRGRISTAEKIKLAERTEKVFPEDIPQENCTHSHTRVVWRLENGRALLVAYEVYRFRNAFGRIPGVVGRGEFGIEFMISIAYQVYMLGIPFDKVCLLMNFFQGLKLKKSQVDSLLNQLWRSWEDEFETLCTLLAHSAIVHTDETGWREKSVWAFLSENVRLLFFGVHKDAATLQQILDPQTYGGLLVSDDAAVYANFTNAQKCWAHLLRKAIKLTLSEPDNEEFRQFLDRLLEIYYEACRIQRDGRLSDAGRQRKVAALDDEILELCGSVWSLDLPVQDDETLDDYRKLVNEFMRLMLSQQLFTFVTTESVTTPSGEEFAASGTNNKSERTLRSPAQVRNTGRMSKTPRGDRRRTVHVSMFESLRQFLPEYTLESIVAEVDSWVERGESCFTALLKRLKLPPPEHSVLDALLPLPEC